MEKSRPEVEEDVKIPVLSVLKKGTILKNIFLNTPLRDQEPSNESFQAAAAEEEEPILIGRHPDCHVVLDHPSISRFHLELRASPRLRKLTATDRSSVHGTWVSGTKIPPNVPVDLVEGDLLKLGSSTRVYRLIWLSLSDAFEMEKPLPPLLEEKEEAYQPSNDQEEAWAAEIPSAPPLPEFSEWELPSPAKEELVDGSSSFCSVPPVLESAEKLPTSESEKLSPARSEKRGPLSSLLSRRSKSKSISFLRIHTGRSKEKLRDENDVVSGQEKKEETICRVLFDNLDGKEEEGTEEAFASDKENVTPQVSVRSKMKKTRVDMLCAISPLDLEEDVIYSDKEKIEEINKVSFDNLDVKEEEAFASDKENVIPQVSVRSKMKKTQVDMLCAISPLVLEEDMTHSDKEKIEETICEVSFDDLDIKEEEAFASDKENVTPQVSVPWKMKTQVDTLCAVPPLDLDEDVIHSDIKNSTPGVLRELKPNESILNESNCSDKENLTPGSSSSHKLKKGQKLLQKSLAKTAVLNAAEDAFYSDKENWTPDSVREMKSRKPIFQNCVKVAEKEVLDLFSDKENLTPASSRGLKRREDISKSCARMEREMMKRRGERIPFQPLLEYSSPLRSSSSLDNAQLNVFDDDFSNDNHVDICQNEVNNFLSQSKIQVSNESREEKKVWNMVVDTSCFLDEESRRSLKLLEGLKGTHLIVPRIVIRELDLMKRRESLFRRSSKASSVLQWIEECMEKANWWIHVQSSQETMPIAPTPPVTPTSQFGDGNFEFGPNTFNSMVSPAFGKLMEIVSPTAEDHILDCALLFRKLKNDEQIVVLSNSTTLSIKAMAEGLLCEAPKEFRKSLVNPYSKRFMWVDSSPIGSTWSCSDQVGLMDNYYYKHNPTSGRTVKGAEAVKGLKLILLHNSHYLQTNSVK
ncbi:uncharacterized protein [Typha angustifolia]|uniref:uncharacterized protein n=1 Tax=Typha angustifolia TaxID=59011 RepID=UPI003C2C3394